MSANPIPILVAVLALYLAPSAGYATASTVNWRDWNAATFTEARSEGKLILLDLVALWCHWCHVMDEKTYGDPRVRKALAAHYVPVQVDHDARPDLAQRYRRWGWPATIVLRPDGTELLKRAGYIHADEMLTLLRDLRQTTADPSPGNGAIVLSTSPYLSAAGRRTLETAHRDSYDPESGGLRLMQKFLDPDAVAWGMRLAAAGDAEEARRTRHGLDAALALLDPAFGGFYQYSTHGDWKHPHYEKIMSTQAGYLRSYALAYEQFADPDYLAAAEATAAYLRDSLRSEEGAFYTSQDADLVPGRKAHDYFALGREARLARGLPRVDRNRYARENGQAAEALAELFRVSGKLEYLRMARRAVRWVEANRALPGGGFRHDEADPAGPYLGDTLAMGRAYLALFQATRDRGWLRKAGQAAVFMEGFRQPGGGLVSALDNGTPVRPLPQMDENIRAVGFLNELAGMTDNEKAGELAGHALRYLVTPAIAESRLTDGGILLVEADYRRLTGR